MILKSKDLIVKFILHKNQKDSQILLINFKFDLFQEKLKKHFPKLDLRLTKIVIA